MWWLLLYRTENNGFSFCYSLELDSRYIGTYILYVTEQRFFRDIKQIDVIGTIARRVG